MEANDYVFKISEFIFNLTRYVKEEFEKVIV